MKILIKNGIVVNADNIKSLDIRCIDGSIVELGTGLKAQGDEKIIDARDFLVFPGGIDPHVHMQLPTGLGTSSDDFHSGSIAALIGGTTTIIDFVTPEKGQSLSETIALRKKEAEDSVIDYSFHVSPIEWRKGMANEISDCVDHEGLRSFKAYMAYKDSIGLEDEALEKVMNSIAKSNGILAVHCELGDEIEELRSAFAEKECLSPEYHALSRPAELEALAVKRLIGFVEKTNCTLYIVHVSSAKSLEYIQEARDQKLPVHAETCPQYLMLDDSKYKLSYEEASKYIMSPPLRKTEDNEALWQALGSGLIQTVGTDHCPFTSEQKKQGLVDFRKIPNGAGGVEHRLSLLYTYGVLQKRISLQQFVGLTSTNAAKIFGLFPQKGHIGIGSDADLLIWDPNSTSKINAANHHMQCDFNIYENMEIQGNPAMVISNGKILVNDNKATFSNQQGRFLKTNSL